MKNLWKILKIIGYIIAGIFGINLLYVLFIYGVRHEDWFFIYNPNFGHHSNAELAWQIIYSVIVVLIAWGLISLSKKKLKSASPKIK
jgi:heme/copper-type cytochrome/quinol oxidase subunit 2